MNVKITIHLVSNTQISFTTTMETVEKIKREIVNYKFWKFWKNKWIEIDMDNYNLTLNLNTVTSIEIEKK